MRFDIDLRTIRGVAQSDFRRCKGRLDPIETPRDESECRHFGRRCVVSSCNPRDRSPALLDPHQLIPFRSSLRDRFLSLLSTVSSVLPNGLERRNTPHLDPGLCRIDLKTCRDGFNRQFPAGLFDRKGGRCLLLLDLRTCDVHSDSRCRLTHFKMWKIHLPSPLIVGNRVTSVE